MKNSATLFRFAAIIFFLVAALGFFWDSGNPAVFLALGAVFIALSASQSKKNDS